MKIPEAQIHRVLQRVSLAESGCMVWSGAHTKDGYAKHTFTVDGKRVTRRVHRVLYERSVGVIPDGMVLDHLCRNRGCVNHTHLEAVTNGENIRRGWNSRGPVEVCGRGHPLNDQNVRTSNDGRRRCRTCWNQWRSERRKGRAADTASA